MDDFGPEPQPQAPPPADPPHPPHPQQVLCSPELRSIQKLSEHLLLGTAVQEGDGVVVPGLAVFVEVSWLLERSRIFKAYVVQTPTESSSAVLYALPLPSTAAANACLRKAFSFFESDHMVPVNLKKGKVVFAKDAAQHLGLGAQAIRVASTSSLDSQLTQIALNVNLHRLGRCIPDKRLAYSKTPVTDQTKTKFYQTFQLPSHPMDPNHLHTTVFALGKLIQRNLYLLGLYPLDQSYKDWIESEWIDGLICNTTLLGMTEFVSEFGPFDATSLFTLSEHSILLPSLISTLFKTTLSLRHCLTSVGFPPGKITTTAAASAVANSGGSAADTSYSQHLQNQHIGDWIDFQRCIRSFQTQQGLKVTGVLDGASRKRLNSMVKETNGGGIGVGAVVGVGEVTGSVGIKEENNVLILGQQSAQRGMDRWRGNSGVGVEVDAEEVENLGIDLFLHVAKSVEEGHRARDILLREKAEKNERKAEARKMVRRMRDVGSGFSSPARKDESSFNPMRNQSSSAVGGMGIAAALANPRLLHIKKRGDEVPSAGPPAISVAPPPPVAAKHSTQSPHSQPFSPYMSVNVGYSPSMQQAHSTSHLVHHSHDTAPKAMSPVPSSDNDESESEDCAALSSSPQKGKMLLGLKKLSKNVKQMMTGGAGNVVLSGGEDKPVKSLSLELDGDELQQQPAKGNVKPRLSVDHVGKRRESADLLKRSMSDGELSGVMLSSGMAYTAASQKVSDVPRIEEGVVTAEPIEDQAVVEVRKREPTVSHSVSDSRLYRLSGVRERKSHVSLVAIRTPTLRRPSEDDSKRSSITSASRRRRPKSVKRKLSHKKVRDDRGDNSDTAMSHMRESIRKELAVKQILETSTDIPLLTSTLHFYLTNLQTHPKVSTEPNPDPTGALPTLLYSIQHQTHQLSLLTTTTTTTPDPSTPTQTDHGPHRVLPLDHQSIASLHEHLHSLQSRIQESIQTRTEHKAQLMRDLESLVSAGGSQQGQTALQIEALNTQTMKLKYAVGLLEGRVVETEEAARGFVQRVEAVEGRLKEGRRLSGIVKGRVGEARERGFFDWLFRRE
ncbi:hypothetical protein HDU98_002565 [Podochytrium sp. JEL0797]|nr:hypothetical protein HDU98_002565 [Podochytrium sp. JEL0797]